MGDNGTDILEIGGTSNNTGAYHNACEAQDGICSLVCPQLCQQLLREVRRGEGVRRPLEMQRVAEDDEAQCMHYWGDVHRGDRLYSSTNHRSLERYK